MRICMRKGNLNILERPWSTNGGLFYNSREIVSFTVKDGRRLRFVSGGRAVYGFKAIKYYIAATKTPSGKWYANGIKANAADPGLPVKRTNDLKKGDWFLLRNGWVAEMKDNRRGQTRMAEVHGFYTEIGSVYSHDILCQLEGPDTPFQVCAGIEHTPKQLKLKEVVENDS